MNPNKNTKTGPCKSGDPPTSLARQGLDVLKDILVEEMAEENCKLGMRNDELEPVGETLNSKVHVLFLGDEITVDLGDGERTKDGYVVPIRDVAPIPLLDLAKNSMYNIVFSDKSDKEWKLNVKLGNIAIGNPPMSISTVGHVEARNASTGRPHLSVILSPLVSISGDLSNVSGDDIADNFEDFNQKATTRLMIGLPTPVNDERDITFTLNAVHLNVQPEMLDVALLNYDAVVNEMPNMILRRKVRDIFDTDKTFRKVLERNVALQSAHKKLLSTREWLANIRFRYHGGFLNFSLDDGLLGSTDGHRAVMIKLFAPGDGISDCKSCPFNKLNEVSVHLGGIKISGPHSGPQFFDIDYDPVRIYIIMYGHVHLAGRLHFRGIDPETFQWPGNNMFRALRDSLRGLLTLPDEIYFVFFGLILRCSNRHIAQAVEVLGMPDIDGVQEESTEEAADEKRE